MSFRDGVEITLVGIATLAYTSVWLIRTARKRKLEGADIFRCALFAAVSLFFLVAGAHAILSPSP